MAYFLSNCFCPSGRAGGSPNGIATSKARNLANNPRFVVCTEHVNQAVIVEGIVDTGADPSLKAEFCRAYEKKYHWDMSDFREPIFVIRPVVVFAITESSGEYTLAGSATRWIFE